jgi:hypothetical protein
MGFISSGMLNVALRARSCRSRRLTRMAEIRSQNRTFVVIPFCRPWPEPERLNYPTVPSLTALITPGAPVKSVRMSWSRNCEILPLIEPSSARRKRSTAPPIMASLKLAV